LGQFLRLVESEKRPAEILRAVQSIALGESSIGRFLELAPYGPSLLQCSILLRAKGAKGWGGIMANVTECIETLVVSTQLRSAGES
jgi:hypothetical protein